jgi:signal transduction histidine kinase
MNAQALSAFVAAIATFAIGGSVVLREPRRRSYLRFATLSFNLTLWHITTAVARAFDSELFYLISLAFAVGIPLSALRFFGAFLSDDPQQRPALPRTLWLPAVLCWLLVLARGLLPTHDPTSTLWQLLGQPLGRIVGIYVFSTLSLTVVSTYRKYRSTLSRMEKLRLTYLLIGGVVTFGLTGSDLILASQGSSLAISNVLTTLFLYFLSQALLRYRLLDLNEVLGRMVVLTILVLILSSIYLALLTWVGAERRGLLFFNTLVASFVILILVEPLRTKIDELVSRWLFRETYDFRQRIDTLRRELANVIDPAEMVRRVLATFEESRRATHASVYLLDRDGSAHVLAGHLGPSPAPRIEVATRRPFFDRLRHTGTLSIEGLEREQSARVAVGENAEAEVLDAVARTLEDIRSSVSIPIVGDDGEVLGLVGLRDERLREAYSSDELDLLRGLAHQLSITLQNSALYERMKERDRLAALGEMAAGLAHEIRNPLGAIKGAAQLLQPTLAMVQDDVAPAAAPTASGGSEAPSTTAPTAPSIDGASREFVDIIIEEANRLNRVVSQFLDYARPFRGDLKPVELEEILRRTVQLLQSEEAASRCTIDLRLDGASPLPPVRGDGEQLLQVFLNLGLNALQAMTDGGTLSITSAVRGAGRRARGAGAATMVEIRFTDTGPGIATAALKKLFIPFFTTKDKGTGLGLPISQRIVENHGGIIEVRSTPRQGATFNVLLPVVST